MNLKKFRLKFGFTQKEVAKLLGVRRITVLRWETGKVTPKLEKIKKLSDLYSCTIDELVKP